MASRLGGWCRRLDSLASDSASGRFPLGLPRLCCRDRVKFPFQFGKLLRILLHASFESTDLFPEILQFHNVTDNVTARGESELTI